MTKQELIDLLNRQHSESIQMVSDMPDLPDSFGYGYFSHFSCGAMLTKTIDYADLHLELHKLRGVIGDYKIKSYWVPHDGCVCVKYEFEYAMVWYTINDENCDYIITKLSGGRCKIVETTKKEVMCNC